MINILAVFIGGGIGAILRFILGMFCIKNFSTHLPIATIIVNILGCFLIGFFYTYFISKPDLSFALKASLTAGFCGGLSTFSAFSLELLFMLRQAHFLQALSYLAFTIIVCMFSVWFGASIAKIVL